MFFPFFIPLINAFPFSSFFLSLKNYIYSCLVFFFRTNRIRFGSKTEEKMLSCHSSYKSSSIIHLSRPEERFCLVEMFFPFFIFFKLNIVSMFLFSFENKLNSIWCSKTEEKLRYGNKMLNWKGYGYLLL